MTKTTTVEVGVDVDVMTKSVTFVTNETIALMLRIAKGRGLPAGPISGQFDAIERGIKTWLAERTLDALCLQVFLPGKYEAEEEWVIPFAYSANPSSDVRRCPLADIERFCSQLRRIPPEATYKILAVVQPRGSEVDGWMPGERLRVGGTPEEQELGGYGYGHIGARIFYRSGGGGGGPEWSR